MFDTSHRIKGKTRKKIFFVDQLLRTIVGQFADSSVMMKVPFNIFIVQQVSTFPCSDKTKVKNLEENILYFCIRYFLIKFN